MASVGDTVRSKTTGVVGEVTEVIEIPDGTETAEAGVFAPRTDLRVEYADDRGNTAEQLVNEADSEPA
jgi:hypothetical protein